MWNMLLKMALGVLAEFVIAFVTRLRAARADDKEFLQVVFQIVHDISLEHADWPGAQKRAYAFDAIRSHAKQLGKDIADSAINTLIELSVQKIKMQEVA
jgi:hypothetical protein